MSLAKIDERIKSLITFYGQMNAGRKPKVLYLGERELKELREWIDNFEPKADLVYDEQNSEIFGVEVERKNNEMSYLWIE